MFLYDIYALVCFHKFTPSQTLARSFCENKLVRKYRTSALSKKKSIFIYRNLHSAMVFLAYQDQIECLEYPGFSGPQGPHRREGVKGQIGDAGSQGMPGPRRDRGREGPPGKSRPTGIKGIKGEPGLVGNERKAGHCGNSKKKRRQRRERGKRQSKSEASVVPQINWKQCVWKSDSDTDNGKIKVNKNFGLCDTSVQVP